MRRFVYLTGLAILCTGCGDSYREDAVYEGVPTSAWITRLKDENPVIRREAAHALGQLGPDEAEQTLSALVEALKDPDPLVRCHALLAIEQLGTKGRKALGAVSRAILDKDQRVASTAIKVYRTLELRRPSALNSY